MAAGLLLDEVARGGCVDTSNQALALLLCVLGPEDVSRIRLGRLTPFTVQYLRDVRTFFGATFKVEAEAETGTTLLAGMGVGYVNLLKKMG